MRRVDNFGTLIRRIGSRFVAEGKELANAYEKKRFLDALQEQSVRAGREVGDVAFRLGSQFRELAVMAKEPSKLPEAVVLVAAAVVTSGGADANGGVPDLDLTLGIDAHRSVFTHSIISGTLVEGCLYAACTLIGVVYRNLPSRHDALFDLIEQNRAKYLSIAAAGASAGIAYHLAVDATLQPGSYHDLPFSMPLEGHQALMGANAIAEAYDVGTKGVTTNHESVAASTLNTKQIASRNVPDERGASTISDAQARREGRSGIPKHTTPMPPGGQLPDVLMRGETRQLWFAWLAQDDGGTHAVVVVPSPRAYANGEVELFDADTGVLFMRRQVETWPRLTLLSNEEGALRKELAAAYRAARNKQRA